MESNIPRYFAPPDTSFFLFGPRGTGKSTFLKASFQDAVYIDLLRPDIQRKYQARPETLIELVKANPSRSTYVVDEIQRVPELLSAIHSLIESNKNLQFVMTGSSARKIKKSGINLLAGRALLRKMHPFMLSEIGATSDFQDALDTGLLPVISTAMNPADTLNTYISLYIREEVQYEGLTRNIGDFSRFLEVISFSHASMINISNIARDCEVERKVVENYMSILEDILIGTKLRVFSKRARRALVSHPKFYLFDTGVFKALRPKGPLDNPHEIDGAALEGLVYQHLRAWNDYSGNPYEIYFWRSKGGVEVDFILYGASGIHAIEVKNSDRIRPADLRPLREFKMDYPESQMLLLYRGVDRIMRDDVLCVPCEEYIRELVPGRSLPAMPDS